ncbi:uncharacterized protein LOC117212657 [Bombus bifarius]|uniref:Uncharacterized protein LOC117212657 n=2 Tax=Pyrobombus TaxID=144703 RepID=A0A6P8MY92_9HYME|nr:uncharacterized protein LOC117212657 [Bombus bifarius]
MGYVSGYEIIGFVDEGIGSEIIKIHKGHGKKIEERVDGREEEVVIIGGDWNARTGEEAGPINEDLGKEKNRRSKGKTINMEGRTLLKYLEERGWTVINGRDKEGEERTYIGERGNSVIDYVIGNQGATEEIIDMKIGKRTESDHMPLEIEIGRGEKKAMGEDGLENEVWKYAAKEVGEALWALLRKIWNGVRIPEDWKKGEYCTND